MTTEQIRNRILEGFKLQRDVGGGLENTPQWIRTWNAVPQLDSS